MFKKVRNQKGFTLIELIVVIAILAILAAVAIPRLTGFQDSAKKKADIATAKTIATATATLIADQRVTLPSTGTIDITLYGANETAPTASVTPTTASGTNTVIATYIRSYLQSVPKNMAGNEQFFVQISSTGDVTVFAGTSVDQNKKLFPTTGSSYQ